MRIKEESKVLSSSAYAAISVLLPYLYCILRLMAKEKNTGKLLISTCNFDILILGLKLALFAFVFTFIIIRAYANKSKITENDKFIKRCSELQFVVMLLLMGLSIFCFYDHWQGLSIFIFAAINGLLVFFNFRNVDYYEGETQLSLNLIYRRSVVLYNSFGLACVTIALAIISAIYHTTNELTILPVWGGKLPLSNPFLFIESLQVLHMLMGIHSGINVPLAKKNRIIINKMRELTDGNINIAKGERRKSVRLNIATKGEFQSVFDKEPRGKLLTKNFNKGGMLFSSEAILQKGIKLNMKIMDPYNEEEFSCKGEVVSVKSSDEGYDIGIKFIWVREEDINQIYNKYYEN